MELARRHLLDCICLADPSFSPGPHHEIIASVLEQVEHDVWAVKSGQPLDHPPVDRVIITLPPRHGKSRETSIEFPAWVLGRHPDLNVMITSYAAELAEDFSRLARSRLADIGPIFGVKVSKESGAANRWGIARHPYGGMIAAGVAGPISGRGAHIAIIDDPHKNWQEAMSDTVRDTAWDWYRSTLRTRLAPGAAVIVIGTRWHEDDLVGRLLGQQHDLELEVIGRYLGGCDGDLDEATRRAKADPSWDAIERWTVINIPAICEVADSDPLGREVGEAIWPKMYPVQYLEQTKVALGGYLWNALYQQHPAPLEGGIIKRGWWRWYDECPEMEEVIQSWDLTFKEGTGSDYVCGQVWGRVGADKYLLDMINERMDFLATMSAIRRMSEKWPTSYTKLVEDAANGPAILSVLKREIPGMLGVVPKGSKVARAMAVSADIESGNVFLPRNLTQIGEFIEQCAGFPNVAHDDMVDACTQALARLRVSWSRDDMRRYAGLPPLETT